MLCNFCDNRKAKIKINSFTSLAKSLESEVVQGSIISPTLFLLYTNNLPAAGPGCIDVIFADDVTEIITHPSKPVNMMSKRIIQEITRVKTYEYKWKIKTNENKFQILSISKTKPAEIIINNNKLTYNDKIKTLRLTIGRCGIRYHIKERAEKGGAALKQLRHFKNLNEKTLIHLYKALIKPILEYPIIPIYISSSTNKQKLQSVQNRALYMASKLVPPCNITSEQLHIKYSMEPINTILYYRTQKV